jgi:transposase
VRRSRLPAVLRQQIGPAQPNPGISFRALLVGYFEGIDSERSIAWRATDSLGVGHFPGIGLDERSPDHSTLSRTRRLVAVERHDQVLGFVLRVIAARGLLKGKTIGVDATTLEANAAMRSIVRRPRRPLEAGVKVLLIPADPEAAINCILQAIRSGRLTQTRVDASVRKILAAKIRLGLEKNRFVPAEKLPDALDFSANEKLTTFAHFETTPKTAVATRQMRSKTGWLSAAIPA